MKKGILLHYIQCDRFILLTAMWEWRNVEIYVEDEVFVAQYHILIHKNDNMADILNNCSIENQLVCHSYVTKGAVELILRYYGGAAIDIDIYNVIDLLVICLDWKEENLGHICLNYLKRHMNNRLIVDLSNRIVPFEGDIISNVLIEFLPFLRTNSYYLLYTDLLFELPYIFLDFITQIPNLVIPSESSLANRLIDHYENKLKASPNATIKLQQKLKTALINVNWNTMAIVDIDKIVLEIFENINTLLEESSKRNIKRIYYTPPDIKNDVILHLLIKYYSEDPLPISLDQDDKYELMRNSIQPYVESLLSTDDIKQILITLLFIVDLNESLSIDQKLHNRVFDHLVHQYNRCDENIKRIIPKCLIVLIRGESSLHALTELLEPSILDEILKFSEFITDDIYQLILLFKQQPLHVLLNNIDPSSDLFSQDQLASQSPLLQTSFASSPNLLLNEDDDDEENDERQQHQQQFSPLQIPSYHSSQSSQKTPPQLPPSSPYSKVNKKSSSSPNKPDSVIIKKEKSSPPIKRESNSNRTSPYETRSKKRMKIEESPSVDKNNDDNKRNRRSSSITKAKPKPKLKSKSRKTRSSDFESDDNDDDDDYESDDSVVSIHSDEELLEMERAANSDEIGNNKSNKNKRNNSNNLTVFYYNESLYSLFAGVDYEILPECDGEGCEFSITPPFPDYLHFDKTNGKITGNCPSPSSAVDYDVTCKDQTNTLHFKLSIEVKLVTFHFCEEYKSENLELSKGLTYVKSLSTISDECSISHCYINVEMRKGIYHIKYQSFTPHVVLFGSTTTNTSNNPSLHDQRNSWTIDIHKNGVILYGRNKCQTPKWKAVKNAIYEMIYDMNNKIISIKLPDGTITEIFKHVGTPLFPFVGLFYKHSAVKLISVETDM